MIRGERMTTSRHGGDGKTICRSSRDEHSILQLSDSFKDCRSKIQILQPHAGTPSPGPMSISEHQQSTKKSSSPYR